MLRGLRLVILMGCTSVAALPALAATPPGCDLHWQLTPQREASPPRVQVDMHFAAGARTRTDLLLPEGSEVSQRLTEGSPALEAVPGRPLLRRVAHPPGQPLRLSFAVTPGDAAWARLAPQSLVFAGRALLPVPVPLPGEAGDWQMCASVSGLAADELLLASMGPPSGADRLLRLQGPTALARDWFIAAGALQQAERQIEGQHWQVLLAAAPPPPVDAQALADAAAPALGAVRRFWADGPAATQWLVLLPAAADTAPRSLALPGALVLQWPANAPLPGPQFDEPLLHGTLQAWFRERFGPVAYDHQPAQWMNAWFTNGFSRFYAQRLRSSAGGALTEHAAALNTVLHHGPAVPGDTPWLAMRWHGSLREQGHAGLDAVLRKQLLPAEQARSTGPLSSPLAPQRLLAALRPLLADAPRRDLQQLTERTPDAALAAQWLTPQTLGPCFRFDATHRQVTVADAEPSPACRGWLDGSAPLLGKPVAEARSAKARPGTRAKAGGKARKPTRRTRR